MTQDLGLKEYWVQCRNCAWEGYDGELIDDELCPMCGSSLVEYVEDFVVDLYDENGEG